MDVACARLEAVGRVDGLIATTDADSGGRLRLDRPTARGDRRRERRRSEARWCSIPTAPSACPERSSRAARPSCWRRKRAAECRGPAEHAHFSGASSGLQARAYRQVGGMGWISALEDQDLEDRLAEAGVRSTVCDQFES